MTEYEEEKLNWELFQLFDFFIWNEDDIIETLAKRTVGNESLLKTVFLIYTVSNNFQSAAVDYNSICRFWKFWIC